ncbi:hypothetical protein JL721_4460 [Aureococcus anophagefferens]|nr:hypothetical protein JL721_4460 [Aureococcus anophagefferens]
MHGRKKQTQPPSAEAVAALAKKAANYRKLSAIALAAKAAKKHDDATFAVVEKLLTVNPDVHTLWNFRKEMLLARAGDGGAVAVGPELALTAACLKKQPKSYGSWYHRLWAVRREPARAPAELELCAEFLKLDERNFHCWNYRRDVSRLAGESPADVLAYARGRLDANFSNYSAFHELAAHLPRTLDRETARRELDVARQALFCEPDDQSAWWYHADVLRRCEAEADLVDAEIATLRELRDLEPGSKWPALALLRLLLRTPRAATHVEVARLHADLRRIDPAHAHVYGADVPVI